MSKSNKYMKKIQGGINMELEEKKDVLSSDEKIEVLSLEPVNEDSIDSLVESGDNLSIEEAIVEQPQEIIEDLPSTNQLLESSDEPVTEIPVETPPEIAVQFKWDGRIKPGLFLKLINSNLNTDDEKMWVRKFADMGLAIKTILNPDKVYSERIIQFAINPELTWQQYKEWKKQLGK